MSVDFNISLTDTQNKIKKECIDWFNSESRKKNEPVFPILGISGSGKSTLISFIISEINLKDEEVRFVAFTGMASLVLVRKGLSACTIHRLIYDSYEVYDKITKKKKIAFKLKDKLDEKIKLIVVDEGSMVSENMMNELISFHIPIIMLGDYFQLQPIGGQINRFMFNTNYTRLSEPMRQALDNPIVWMANELRNGIRPKYGSYDGKVNVYSKRDFPEECLTDTDQILAGKNNTCDYINKIVRIKYNHIKSRYPVVGDRLICLKNNWEKCISENLLDTFLVNGLLGTVKGIQFIDSNQTYSLDFQPIFMNNTYFTNLLSDTLVFDDINCKDENYIADTFPQVFIRRQKIYLSGMQINKFSYGYCVTVYKMQGSQERKITYIDEVLNRNTYFNHFYTAITRAEEYCDIIM